MNNTTCYRKLPYLSAYPVTSKDTSVMGFITTSSSILLLLLALRAPRSEAKIPCGIRPASTRIVGGKAVTDPLPWMAALLFKSNPTFVHCGASVISKNFLVTAAHCFYDERHNRVGAKTFQVSVGDLNFRNGQVHDVELVELHPLYRHPIHYFDVAVIKIAPSLSFDGVKINRICLPEEGQALVDKRKSGQSVKVVGWGVIEDSGHQTQTELREVDIQIVALRKCRNEYLKADDGFNMAIPYGIDDNFICAAASGKDSCSGDSGGPLMVLKGSQWFVAGIVSFGKGCARPDFPGVYTDVTKFVNFIQSVHN